MYHVCDGVLFSVYDWERCVLDECLGTDGRISAVYPEFAAFEAVVAGEASASLKFFVFAREEANMAILVGEELLTFFVFSS